MNIVVAHKSKQPTPIRYRSQSEIIKDSMAKTEKDYQQLQRKVNSIRNRASNRVKEVKKGQQYEFEKYNESV